MYKSRENKYHIHVQFFIRRFPIDYYFNLVLFAFIVYIPIIIDDFFIQSCFPGNRNPHVVTCPIPVWQNIYLFTVLSIVLVCILSGRFVNPKGPMLTISKTGLRYNRIPFFLRFSFLDKIFWKSYPVASIASIHLIIREQDSEKAGFKLSSNQEDINKYYKNIPYSEIERREFFSTTSDRYGMTPVYKNQKLVIINKDKSRAELIVSFAYEEDLQKLDVFLKEKGISFTVSFQQMNDAIKDLYGQNFYDKDR